MSTHVFGYLEPGTRVRVNRLFSESYAGRLGTVLNPNASRFINVQLDEEAGKRTPPLLVTLDEVDVLSADPLSEEELAYVYRSLGVKS